MLPEATLHGEPDLIVKVLSPGNPERDPITKKELYERFKVKDSGQ